MLEGNNDLDFVIPVLNLTLLMQFEFEGLQEHTVSKTNKQTNKQTNTKTKQKKSHLKSCVLQRQKKPCLEGATALIGIHFGYMDKTCYETLERIQKALGKVNRPKNLKIALENYIYFIKHFIVNHQVIFTH